MFGFVARRLAQSAGVMLGALFLAFLMFRYAGDPVNQMVGADTALEQRTALREQLGLNDPPPVQFARYVAGALRFDFGVSYQHKRPVSQMLAEKFPATFELALLSALIALLLGIPMGIFAGLHKNHPFSKCLMTLSLVGVSLPTFIIGILLIYYVGIKLGWRPIQGREGVVDLGFWTTSFLTVEGWRSLLLPAATLGIYQMTLIMRLTRAEIMEVMRTDYIKFARARGLSESAVVYRHGLRNALLPVVTIAGLQFGFIIAFSVVTESVFTWPGIGQMFLHAVGNVDIPVMAAYLALVAFLFVVINLATDILCYALDPRLRAEKQKAAPS